MTANYQPEEFWSDVARRMAARPVDDEATFPDDLPFYRYKRSRFVERFLDSLDVRGQKVLELGCGPAGNLSVLGRRGPARLVGADVSQAMLDLAAAKLARARVDAELVKVDGVTLPFADDEFDTSLTVTVLHHNLDEDAFRALVQELCRVTAKRVVLVEDTRPSIKTGFATVERPIAVYERALADNGFVLARTEFLDTKATFFAHRACLKLWRIARSRTQDAPEPSGAMLGRVLKLANAITRPIDNVWTDHAGLTKMSFAKAH